MSPMKSPCFDGGQALERSSAASHLLCSISAGDGYPRLGTVGARGPRTGCQNDQRWPGPCRSTQNADQRVNRGATSVRFLTVYYSEQGKPLAERASDPSPRRFRTATVLQSAKTWTGEPILYPLSANQFTVQIVEFAPGAAAPRHVHPPTQFFYVLEGYISIEASDHPRRTVNPGEVEWKRPYLQNVDNSNAKR